MKTKLALIAFSIGCIMAGSVHAVSYSQSVLNDSPVLYWRFNDAGGAGSTVADSSGNARTGTVGAGGPVFGVSSASAQLGTGIQFTGPDANNASTKRITFDGAVPELINVRPPSVNKSTTVEYWVRYTQQGSGDNTWTNPSILGDESPGDGDMYWGNIANGGQFRMSTSDIREIRVNNIDDDEWHHIVMVKTWDTVGPSVSSLYLDGVLFSTVNTAGGNASYQDADAAIFALGLTTNGGGNVQYVGFLDELAIYNRALTAQEVLTHYQAAFIPEPATGFLALLGLAGLARRRRRAA